MAMMTPNLTNPITRLWRALYRAIGEVAPDARKVVRKPAVILEVLLRAYRAHIALAVSILFLLFIAPQIVDFTTGMVFPPQTSKKFFGLIKRQKQDPARQFADSVLTTALWITSVGAVAVFFWLSIPGAVLRTTARSKRLVGEAAAVLESDPTRSLALYRQALARTTDPEQELALKTTVHKLEAASAPHLSVGETAVDSVRGTLCEN
ncbi:MAG: hypothetical protein OEV80_10910, partial [candidate division Zixibacteria bacterium]|nr:hypothetical protein [candidate division Zixibacteria bacterium]